jgi:multidrug resistance efflux pump
MALASTPGAARVVFSGEVYAVDAQAILVPPSDTSPVALRFYLPEGATVKPGDVVLRIDAGQAGQQINTLKPQRDQARARAAKEMAELQVKAIDAERLLVDAQAAFDKAAIDAAIPRAFLSALDFDRYQGELARTRHELEVKRGEFEAARAAVTRRQRDGEIEVAKFDAEIAYYEAQASVAEVRATTAGTLVHGFDSWRGNRFDEGASGFPGLKVGEIVAVGRRAVRGFLIEADRGGVTVGDAVKLRFDALPDLRVDARVTAIAGVPEAKAEWGEGRYFRVEITLPDQDMPRLLPGMSVRIEHGEGAPVSP